jgi:hypothetical protein
MARSRSGDKFLAIPQYGLRNNRHRDYLETVQPGRIAQLQVKLCRQLCSL